MYYNLFGHIISNKYYFIYLQKSGDERRKHLKHKIFSLCKDDATCSSVIVSYYLNDNIYILTTNVILSRLDGGIVLFVVESDRYRFLPKTTTINYL
jgi:hypothetical protein